MSTAGANRTQRYRDRLKRCGKGDHSLCSPQTKCPAYAPAQVHQQPGGVTPVGDVTGDVTSPPSADVTQVPPPAGLGPRGTGLWERVETAGMGPLHLVLLEEACRITDTLERLHTLAEDGRLLEMARNEAASDESVAEVRLVVNPLLAEIRQQQHTFRQKVAELRVAGRAGTPGVLPGVGAADSTADQVDPVGVSGGEGGLGDLIHAAARFRAPAEG